jgi:hypothetical protein
VGLLRAVAAAADLRCAVVAGYSGSAVLVQEERRIPVACAYDVTTDPTGGPVSWSGVFTAGARSLPWSGDAVLELPDGSRGDVIITPGPISDAMPTRSRGSFTGNGDPP